jgi:hypothetical protein
MRFAYIDSQGNEVSIPSIDALALRIELGAIGPDTELYDAAADRWAPAHQHEIFHTLSRSKEEGFVAPPPPVAHAPGPSQEEGAAGEVGEPAETEAAATGEEPEPASDHSEALEPEVEEEVRLDFTLTDADPAAKDEQEGVDESPEDVGELMEFEFTEQPFGEPEAEDPGAESGDGASEEPGAFDFGDMESLELEEEEEEEEDSALPGHGMKLEEPLSGGEMDFSGQGMERLDASLDLEPPMSDFTAETPPSWMEQEGPESEPEDGEIMDLSRPEGPGADEEPGAAPPTRRRADGGEGGDAGGSPPKRPEPRSRPSPPRRRKRFPIGTVVGVVVVLVAVGVGGWFGWSTFQARRVAARAAAAKEAALPPVTIPEIPAGLRPRMRELGEAALSGMIQQFRADENASGIPAGPSSAWLGGAYLSNASRYPDIQRYWVLIDSFVDHLRTTDTKVFHDQYVKELDSAGIQGDTASMLLARADSGFLATRAARLEAYNQMDDLTNAALDLHQFLLRHEADITYAPAAGGVSQDPVLEAVPSTKALGTRMWGMVDRITGALNELGTLDKVTTDRLFTALFGKVRAAGFK